jgi:hypothetical protein
MADATARIHRGARRGGDGATRGAGAAARASSPHRRVPAQRRNRLESMSRVAALLQGLQELGWTDGRNVRIDFRWGAGEADQYRKIAAELIALGPDVVVTLGTLVSLIDCYLV